MTGAMLERRRSTARWGKREDGRGVSWRRSLEGGRQDLLMSRQRLLNGKNIHRERKGDRGGSGDVCKGPPNVGGGRGDAEKRLNLTEVSVVREVLRRNKRWEVKKKPR